MFDIAFMHQLCYNFTEEAILALNKEIMLQLELDGLRHLISWNYHTLLSNSKQNQ